MNRCVIVTCTREIANLLRAGKAPGCSVVSEQESFERNEYLVKLSSPSFPEVSEGRPFPKAMLQEQADQTLKVVLL